MVCICAVANSLPPQEVQPLAEPQRQATEVPKKRQTTSYTTNIIHDDSSEDGKAAQSSISVNFGHTSVEQTVGKNINKTPTNNYLKTHNIATPTPIKVTQKKTVLIKPLKSNIVAQKLLATTKKPPAPQINPYPTPKTIFDYMKKEMKPEEVQNLQASKNSVSISRPANLDSGGLLAPLLLHNQGNYLNSQDHPNTLHREFHQPKNFHQKNFEQKTPQLFNVGYSINIGNNQEPKLQFRLPNPPHPKGLRGDIITGSHKDAVGRPSELNLVSHLPTFAGPTQIHHPLSVVPGNYISLDQKDQFPTIESNNKNGYVWKNLGSGVEISGYVTDEEQQQKFDHAAALGRSEGFDITNVVDTDGHVEPVYFNTKPAASVINTVNHKPFDKPNFEFLKNFNPGFFKQDFSFPPQQPKFEILKSVQPQLNDLTVFSTVGNPKIIGLPNIPTQKFVNFQPEQIPNHEIFQQINPQKLAANQYQIHENINEEPPREIFRHGRYLNPGPPPKNFPPPYRMRVFPRESPPHFIHHMRPPPFMIRIPKYTNVV